VRALIVWALSAVLVSCGGSDKGPVRAETSSSESGARATADEDVAVLGREIFDLIDRSMSYRSSHRGRLPKNLRELGIDELTPTTSRSLTVSGNVPTVTAGFRSTASHTLATCRGTNALLEEASLSGGEFSLICSLVSGGTTTLKAQR
jgi:hypothetical protein